MGAFETAIMDSMQPTTLTQRILRKIAWNFKYYAFVRRLETRAVVTRHAGFRMHVNPGVFHPGLYLTSRFFADYLSRLNVHNLSVLDMGCGSGILALVAAAHGARVTAVDINPAAVADTETNARENGVASSIQTFVSDLFGSLPSDTLFDLILWNPPFFAGVPENMAQRAWVSGRRRETIDSFADQATSWLAPGGKVLIVLSSVADTSGIIDKFSVKGYAVQHVASKRKFFETLEIYQFSLC